MGGMAPRGDRMVKPGFGSPPVAGYPEASSSAAAPPSAAPSSSAPPSPSLPAAGANIGGLSLEELRARFLRRLAAADYSRHTVRAYGADVEQLVSFLQSRGRVYAADVRVDDLRLYVSRLAEGAFSPDGRPVRGARWRASCRRPGGCLPLRWTKATWPCIPLPVCTRPVCPVVYRLCSRRKRRPPCYAVCTAALP